MSYLLAATQMLFSSKAFSLRVMELEAKATEDPIKNARSEQFLSQMKSLASWSLGKGFVKFSSPNSMAQIKKFSEDLSQQRELSSCSALDQQGPADSILKLLKFASSNISDLFELQTKVATVNCDRCKKTLSRKPKKHFVLDLSITPLKHLAIQNAIETHLAEELELHCPKCSTVKKAKQEIWQAPDLLLVHVLRYSRQATGTIQKNETPIYVSGNLVFRLPANSLSRNRFPATPHSDKALYLLTGVINHQGSTIDSGHFTAMVKEEVENQWIRCNDAKVEVISVNDVIYDDEVEKTCQLMAYKRVGEFDELVD